MSTSAPPSEWPGRRRYEHERGTGSNYFLTEKLAVTKKETVARVGASNPLLGGLPMRLWFVFTVVGRIARIDARGRRAYPVSTGGFPHANPFCFFLARKGEGLELRARCACCCGDLGRPLSTQQ